MIRHRALWARAFLAMAVLVAAMIFWFSAQPGDNSQTMSDGITFRAARILRPDLEGLPPGVRLRFLEILSAIVRKGAHFCEYALLGFNLAGYFHLRPRSRSSRGAVTSAWLAGTLYAATDELHQLFVSERSAAVLDAGIDSVGALAGALVMAALLSPASRRRRA